MSVGSRIKELRDHKSISRNELAKKLDVTPGAISNYENGVSSPKEPILFKIMDVLECDANYLYQDDMDIAPSIFTVTLAEQGLLTKYRALDTKSKGAIDTLIEYEYEQTKLHILAHEDIEQYPDNIIPMFAPRKKILHRVGAAGAGVGEIADNIETVKIDYPADKVPDGTDYTIDVTGDSMEPTYSNGDVLFCERGDNNLNFGDVGIFIVDGETLVKEYGKTGLVSHNKKYDIMKISDYGSFKVEGKVLGKL